MFDIRLADFPRDLECVRALFRDYAASLDISLDFQDFDSELLGLPGQYALPRGRLLLAWPAGEALGEAVGCVALRPLEGPICEMKRLYVSPRARASGLGRRLAEDICAHARTAGYSRMRLDTLPSMSAARRVYGSLGFRPIPSYCFNPVPDTVFLERDLLEAVRGEVS